MEADSVPGSRERLDQDLHSLLPGEPPRVGDDGGTR
jgi:hypothetical protein